MLALVALLVPCGAATAPPLAYLADLSNQITVVDTVSNAVAGHISPPLADGFTGVAVSPDGSRLYIADGNHTVHVVTSPSQNPSFDLIVLDQTLTPINLVVTPDGSTVYVTNANTNTVSIIDAATHAVSSVDIMCDVGGTNNCSSLPPIAVTPDANAFRSTSTSAHGPGTPSSIPPHDR